MRSDSLQAQCENGQRLLMNTQYVEAERVLSTCLDAALSGEDFDTVQRVCLPLQEARRQRRQCCGEGAVLMRLSHPRDAERINKLAKGQIAVTGRASLSPAVSLRRRIDDEQLYLETFLAAHYPCEPAGMLIAPLASTPLPQSADTLDQLREQAPERCIVLADSDLIPDDQEHGTAETYAYTMGLWEQLHAPYLADALAETNPRKRIPLLMLTIEVDYACELAHQHLADAARELRRQASNTQA